MYSLLCRHARISAFNQVPEGEEAAPADGILADQQSPPPNRARWLERSKPLQKALLGIVLLGTAFMFCDGILSPAASGGLSCDLTLKYQHQQHRCMPQLHHEGGASLDRFFVGAVVSAMAGVQVINPHVSNGESRHHHTCKFPCRADSWLFISLLHF